MRLAIRRFDAAVIERAQVLPVWFRPIMQLLTLVGQPVFVVVIAVVMLYLELKQTHLRLALAYGTILIVIGVGSLLKYMLHRVRPDTKYAKNMWFHTYSFPSGHATSAMVGFGVLGYLLLPAWSVVALLVGILLAICVGISRVYLGAHFPSDVVGGWILGFVGLLAVIFAVQP